MVNSFFRPEFVPLMAGFVSCCDHKMVILENTTQCQTLIVLKGSELVSLCEGNHEMQTNGFKCVCVTAQKML